jgi:hypothetical protein
VTTTDSHCWLAGPAVIVAQGELDPEAVDRSAPLLNASL